MVNNVLVGQRFKKLLPLDILIMICLEPFSQRVKRVDKTVVSQLKASLVDANVTLFDQFVHWGLPVSQNVVCLV